MNKTPNSKVEEAKLFALKAHENQKYGICPYSKHLGDVVACLERFGFKNQVASENPLVENILSAGWLHDTIEDVSVTREEIAEKFGDEIADIVSRVSDEKGANRRERKALTYPKIRGNFGATVVKLADRIANVESSQLENAAHFAKYVEEQNEFHAAVYVPMLADPMWNYLRILISKKFGEKTEPLTKANLFKLEQSDIKIFIDAWVEKESLRLEDYAIGSKIESMFGDSDYERTLSVNPELKNSVLLSLINERFHGNSAFSEFQDWLSKNNISYEYWSG